MKIVQTFTLVQRLCLIISCSVFVFAVDVRAGQDEYIGDTISSEQHPVKEFSTHKLIYPKIYHGRQKRQISTTKDEESSFHLDNLMIVLPIEDEELVLDLILNKDLISKGFFRKIQENGIHNVIVPNSEDVNLCHYTGKVKDKPNSWVALSTCNGLSGVIYDGHEMHYIEKKNVEDDNQHVLYNHSDLVEQDKTCGNEYNRKSYSSNNSNKIRVKRTANPVRGPYSTNKETKYVELLLVIDNRKYKDLNESTERVEDYGKSVANIVNALYAPLNIFIALTGIVIWTEQDEINFSLNGDKTLSNFLKYRKSLIVNHPNDNAQLLTKFTFEGGVVGKALKGPICTFEYSGGISSDYSAVDGLVATTVAHMLGHNFGMEHDTDDCTCPDEMCIMNSKTSPTARTHWSSCSKNTLEAAFNRSMDYCLKNKPVALFNGPVCGNSFVEDKEECDCGLPEYCNNTCCDAATCKLYKNATCATGECCDLATCHLKPPGNVCRSADSECDLPEYCTGDSEYCPDNVYKMDTEICQDGKAFCYHGTCRTKNDQCRLLWGETGRSSTEQCYKLNVKGKRHGNCGYNKLNQSYTKCDEEDTLCGMLHCQHESEYLRFGMESVSIVSHSYLNYRGSIKSCRTVIIDLGLDQIDPGLVPNGANCGEGKMCLNQKCVSVDTLRENSKCPHNCYNNGWCNNLGHCHCKDGYILPFCEHLWPGRSVDSGRPSNFNITL